MTALKVTLDGRDALLRPGRTYTVGRRPDADITLSHPSCSRDHAEISFADQAWQVVDVGSRHGTYVGGQRVQRAVLQGRTTVWFSSPGDGTAVVLEPLGDRPAEAGALPDPALQRTVLPSGPAHADAALVLRWDGRDYFFSRGTLVRIGRDDRADLVVSHPSVSRQHAMVVPHGELHWRFEDTSNSGSYVNGSRVHRLELSGPTSIRLGDPTTGAELLVTPVLPPGADAPPSGPGAGKVLLAAGLALTLLAVLLLVGWVVARDSEDPPATAAASTATTAPTTADTGLSEQELLGAKLATVMLTARSTDTRGNEVGWSGSGSIISPDGLILTNAHVASPQAMGLAELYAPSGLIDPEFLLVSLTRPSDDLPAAPAYRAEVVAGDGELDIAILRITATANGDPLQEEPDLPTVPIGDSSALSTGDELTVLGFPGISDSAALSVTRGVVSTFIADAALGSERAEIDTDARIAPGNSGGMAIDDDGELIGVPSAYRQESGVPIVSGRIRPIDLVKPLIAEAEES